MKPGLRKSSHPIARVDLKCCWENKNQKSLVRRANKNVTVCNHNIPLKVFSNTQTAERCVVCNAQCS